MKEYNPYATHQDILLAACRQTTGPIVELGCGEYSTPVLHDEFRNRYLVTVETNAEWMLRYIHLRSPNHVFMLVRDFHVFRMPITPVGVLFVDFECLEPGQRRNIVLQEANNAALIVAHDTEPLCHPIYQWGDCFEQFKYHYTDQTYDRWTTVMSNTQEFQP